MAVRDLRCWLCDNPAATVLSVRIDPGSAHYPCCGEHLATTVARVTRDAARAITRTGTVGQVIDVDIVEEDPPRPVVKIAGYLDASDQWP